METAPVPANEEERLTELRRYQLLDTEAERAYDELTEMAAAICGTPISLISLVDMHRQWFKSSVGIDARETPRDIAFCAHAILQEEVFVVEDASKDARFTDNPLVAEDPNIRFYAGMPLRVSSGHALGTLCVIDREPHHLTEAQARALKILAKQVVNLFELRLNLQRLKELNEKKDRFFSIIAHDLRAPFNAILGLGEILEEDLDSMPPAECREMVAQLNNSSRSALSLVEDLLKWAVNESGSVAFEPKQMDVREAAERVIQLLSGIAADKAITLSLAGVSEAIAYADEHMVASSLQNLVSNAIKFTPHGGSVTVTLSLCDDRIEVSVCDTGIGMDQERQSGILLLDSNLSTNGTDGEQGTGLGLQLCKQFIERNSGKLRVTSQIGKGTTFAFTLLRQPSG